MRAVEGAIAADHPASARTRPIVWSVAGTDSGGGAGLSADQRTADAFGVHLCPVVAAVTAQHSRAVQRVEPLSAAMIDAQMGALADDMPPAAIKTGLLGSAEAVRCVANWVDRLRERGPLALVVDPVLAATTGASFADDATRAAWRDELLPRATLATPNRREAALLMTGMDDPVSLAATWRGRYRGSVCITGGDSASVEGRVLDWIDTPHAAGWLASARIDTPHAHGTGCTFATAAASALALGFVEADALVLAKMATTNALAQGYAAGSGAGPVCAKPGFATEPRHLPLLSWGASTSFAPQTQVQRASPGLYAVVDSAERVRRSLEGGVRTVQLRIKAPAPSNGESAARLHDEILASLHACRRAGARLLVNDHWLLARDLGIPGVHLGQEDLAALGETGRADLLASGLELGISTHSLWELCRARALAPSYVACGPVWPTLTKAMPWRPQGLDNLAWWVRMAGVPVVAIGGVLEPQQAEAAARCRADGVCVVRALGDDPCEQVPPLLAAWHTGHWFAPQEVPPLPHPSL